VPTAPYTLEQAEESIADLRAQVDRLGEVHALDGTGGVIPNAQPNQVQKFAAADGQPGYVTPSGLVMGNMGSQNAFFPGNVATAITLTDLGSWTVPAGDAAGGAVYEVEIWGNGTWGSTQQSLGLQVVFGGNNLSTVTLGASWFAISTTFRIRVVGRVVCHTTGVAGLWSSLIYGECTVSGANALPATGANGSGGFVSCEGAATTAIDTTANQLLGVSAAWQSTTGAPSVTSRVAVPKRIC
jgi:hypothetical protein